MLDDKIKRKTEEEEKTHSKEITRQLSIENPDRKTRRYSGEGIEQKSELRFENLQLTIEKVQDCKKEGFIGDGFTVVGMKNPRSFFIETQTLGHILVEDGVQLYSEKIYGDDFFMDIIYCPTVNCYFLAHPDGLQRKDIDDKPPYLFMHMKFGWSSMSCFIYSKVNQSLLAIKESLNLLVINPRLKKIELELKNPVGDMIKEFRLFGEKDNRVVSLTWEGHVILYSLTHGKKRGVVDFYSIGRIEERLEFGISIAAKNDYVLVEMKGLYNSAHVCSRMIAFKLNGDTLIKKSCIDQYNQKIGEKMALEHCGSTGSHILWVGLSNDNEKGLAQLYDYDTEGEVLQELEDKRVYHQERLPQRLIIQSGKFYYVGWFGKLMRLSLNN